MSKVDFIVVGGGIVGLSTGYNILLRDPRKKVLVLEKESRLAEHQTGRNSGVLHSGIYYKPGSLKALNCREGKQAMERFAGEQGIDFDRCGKVIVATRAGELPNLENIYKRGEANGVRCEMIGPARLKELEPHAAGIKALHVPEAGIINYRQVCERLAAIMRERGQEIVCDAKVLKLHFNSDEVVVVTGKGEYRTRQVVNCAGLYSDKVTALSEKSKVRIIPFRGEFFELKPKAYPFCRNLIYPVPDPSFPFLGAHFTRMIDGTVECGPNAVLAFAREGYRKTDINLGELAETLTYPAFWKIALKYWRTGLGEMWRSLNKNAFVRALQRLVPEIRGEHLEPAPSGIRAQALSREGELVDDFLIQEKGRVVNVCNAPSPAATASLQIGKMIVEKLSFEN